MPDHPLHPDSPLSQSSDQRPRQASPDDSGDAASDERATDRGAPSGAANTGRPSAWEGCSVIAHLDLDCFFAQVEELDDPSIRGKPVNVGPPPPTRQPDGRIDFSKSGRGIVCTANYVARTYGVRTAMPATQAHRLCPDGVYRSSHGERYRELSRAVFAVCEDFTPRIRPVGIDECYLDFSGLERWIRAKQKGSLSKNWDRVWPLVLAEQLRDEIESRTGLTASIGVGPNRFIAKLASDYDKPRGLKSVPPDECEAFIRSLKLGDLRGVGPKTRERLERMGFRTPADIIDLSREDCIARLGDLGRSIWDASHGVPGDLPAEREQRKSISRDRTFAEDQSCSSVAGRQEMLATLSRLTAKATYSLRKECLFATTVSVRVRFADFTNIQRDRSLGGHEGIGSTDQDADIMPVVEELLDDVLERRASVAQRRLGVRLVGVKLGGLSPYQQRQLRIGESNEVDRRAEVYKVADEIRRKLGFDALSIGRAIESKRTRSRHVATQAKDRAESHPGKQQVNRKPDKPEPQDDELWQSRDLDID
ncbi:MAG: DNA polymerase IV [Phycisphaerales bacterium JB050]